MTDYDLVLMGATGFTGGLTADYLAEHGPPGLRWAVAGRDRAKLEAVRARLGVDLGVVVADSADPSSMRRVAEAGRVVVTTVGPYIHYGEPLVAACAEAGTDYLDLTGEAEFVDRMYLRYDATARRTGARLIHACGFDSVPHDLGALFTVSQLPSDVPIQLRGYVRVGGSVSGGTYASAIHAFSRLRQASAVHRQRQRAEAAVRSLGGRRVRGLAGRPGYDRAIGRWVLPLPTIDPQIVLRSARALDQYGPDFQYGHFIALKNPLTAAGLVAGAGAALALAQVPPTRRLLLRARPAGFGPEPAAAGAQLVPGAVHRRLTRGAVGHRGGRWGSWLHRDRHHAGRIGPVPARRRPAGHLGPGHHRGCPGRGPAHPAATGRHHLPHPLRLIGPGPVPFPGLSFRPVRFRRFVSAGSFPGLSGPFRAARCGRT